MHVYNSEMATDLVNAIIKDYIPAFDDLLENLDKTYPADVLETF